MPALSNAKHERFCLEYVIDLNATQAANRAGYSPRTSYQIGHALLKKVEIADRIAELKADAFRKVHMTGEEVLAIVARRARGTAMSKAIFRTSGGEPYLDFNRLSDEELGDIVEAKIDDYMDGRGDDARDVRSVKLKVASPDKNTELVMKHLGLLKDQLDLHVTGDFDDALEAARLRATNRKETA